MPVTIAIVLCFAVSPLVSKLRQFGIGPVTSVLSAVAALVVTLALLAGLIGAHALQMAANLPGYQVTLAKNLGALRIVALSPMERTWDAAEQLLDAPTEERVGSSKSTQSPSLSSTAAGGAMPVEIRPPKPASMERLSRLLSWVWVPLGSAGIVVIVLVFLLLEQESLRDRFIRLVGRSDLRATTSAINDAGERLSRYLARQFAVNIGFGLVIWAALSAVGLPEAALIAALAGVLRFVPYVGVLVTAVLAMLLALGTSDVWTLMAATSIVFITVDAITSHVVEPRVYGRATGLSPLSIVLATLFWGWLWGPAGVIIATPLTLCLAVAGRHAESLGFLDIVLGNGPALTMAQKFYQRALSGDSSEILARAREFLKSQSFAAYCDSVLMPALQLCMTDFANRQITRGEQAALRGAIVHVVEVLDTVGRDRRWTPQRTTVLSEISSGRLLRQRRLLRQQTSTDKQVRTEQVVWCIGTGSPGDDLATELLVRILRGMRLDARHLTSEDLHSLRYSRTSPSAVGAVCLVSMTPPEAPDHGVQLARAVRDEAPHACTLALLLPGLAHKREPCALGNAVDRTMNSYEQAALELHAQLTGAQPERGVDASGQVPAEVLPRPSSS